MSDRRDFTRGVSIELEHLTKVYPGVATPAVNDVTMTIPAGELVVLVGPSVAEQTAVQNELASRDGVPTEGQRRRLERADRLMRLATRIDLPLILLAGLTMAVGRYL